MGFPHILDRTPSHRYLSCAHLFEKMMHVAKTRPTFWSVRECSILQKHTQRFSPIFYFSGDTFGPLRSKNRHASRLGRGCGAHRADLTKFCRTHPLAGYTAASAPPAVPNTSPQRTRFGSAKMSPLPCVADYPDWTFRTEYVCICYIA